MSSDSPKWDFIDVMGDVPQARWRHTATMLNSGNEVLVFGGLNKGKRFNDTYVLSIDKEEWNIKECAGTPPHPRSHHTANLVDFEAEDELELPKTKICIVGGYGGPGTSRDYCTPQHLTCAHTVTLRTSRCTPWHHPIMRAPPIVLPLLVVLISSPRLTVPKTTHLPD